MPEFNEHKPSKAFDDVFTRFVDAYISASNDSNKGLVTEYDSEWPSPCLCVSEQKLKDGQEISWLPNKRDDDASIQNIAQALEISIPDELDRLLSTYYSLDLNAQHSRGKVTLLQAYNEQDFDRLQKNLIAHVLMKRRLKQPDTLFFALTDEDDFIISFELESQTVVLEQVGKPAKETLSASLSDFIQALKPAPEFVVL